VWAEVEEPIVGGANGKELTLSDNEEEQILEDMRAELATKLREVAQTKAQVGYVVVPGGMQIDYSTPIIEPGTEGKVKITESASAQAIAFPEEPLKSLIVKSSNESSEDVDTQEVHVFNYDNLKLDLGQADFTKDIKAKLTGYALIVWDYDKDKLKESLSGKRVSKEGRNAVLKDFPGIDDLEVTIKPFSVLQRRFPKAKKIKIVDKLLSSGR